jgi:hypothetical protein
VVTLALLVVSLSLLQPVSGQPGQWRSINPVNITLNGVWMVAANSGWAVGAYGRAIYWDGSKWAEVGTPYTGTATATLNSVSCLSISRCIAVGTNAIGPPTDAILLQWDGTAWVDRSSLVPGGTTGLNHVYVRSDGLAFAVGTGNPNIIRIPDANVVPISVSTEATVGGPDTLTAVWMISPDPGGTIRAFAVGALGKAWRWDGAGWISEATPVATDLFAVSMVSTTDAFAVGAADKIIRWNGVSWTGPLVPPTAGIAYQGVHMLSSSDGWIVGTAGPVQSSFLHWDGVSWTLLTSNVPTAVGLSAVFMLSTSQGWAVGALGTITQWDGTRWNAISQPVPSPLNSVWMSSSTDGWIVGAGGRIVRFNGVYWNLYQTLPSGVALNSVHGSSASNVWAVGDHGPGPTVEKWDGTSWTAITAGVPVTSDDLFAVFVQSSTFIMAGGGDGVNAGLFIRSTDGSTFGAIPSPWPAGTRVRGIWMLSTTDGWAVGTGGQIARWNGATWASETSPTANDLYHVQALSATDVWAVGASGTILHRDGTGWSAVPSSVTAALNGVYMVSSTEGWAVGELLGGEPVILYWNGLTWTRVFAQPMTGILGAIRAVWMVSSTEGWAVGSIVRFGPTAVTSLTTVPVTVTSTATSTQSVTVTSTVATSTVSTQVTSTQTVSTTTTSVSTSLVTTTATGTTSLPPSPGPIPGFPIESILAGLVAGALALVVLRRHRQT